MKRLIYKIKISGRTSLVPFPIGCSEYNLIFSVHNRKGLINGIARQAVTGVMSGRKCDNSRVYK